MQIYKESILDFEIPFPPLYGGIITIPEGAYFFRGYSTKYPTLSSRPTYFGDINTAKGYATAHNTLLGAFKATKPLHLLDYRFMKVILDQRAFKMRVCRGPCGFFK